MREADDPSVIRGTYVERCTAEEVRSMKRAQDEVAYLRYGAVHGIGGTSV